jgi:hypothetical protein
VAVIPLSDGSVSGAGAVLVISWPGASGGAVIRARPR